MTNSESEFDNAYICCHTDTMEDYRYTELSYKITSLISRTCYISIICSCSYKYHLRQLHHM